MQSQSLILFSPQAYVILHVTGHFYILIYRVLCGVTIGWVAHGFFDGYLDGGLSGAVHWAMCVTCGAWTALSLWEHVSYTGDESTLHGHLLPTFKGIAEFFLEYMFRVDGVYHTGPTSSPENSYTVTDKEKIFAAQLALSPAIDASVLRQVANAYSIAVRMARFSSSTWTAPNISTAEYLAVLNSHSLIATQFRIAISQMPYGAIPVVGVNTGFILEYPAPFPAAKTDAPSALSSKLVSNLNDSSESHERLKEALLEPASITVSEDGDPGHRHFSSMHWLYPGTFLPSDGKLSG